MGAVPKKFNRNNYATPDWLFKAVEARIGQSFAFDLAASSSNTKCSGYFTKKQNSLLTEWATIGLEGCWLWLNPPYKPLKPWIEKAQMEAVKGARIAALVPSATVHTQYFQNYLPNEIIHIVGRVSFLAHKKPVHGNAHCSSVLIYDGTNPNPVASEVRISWME